MQISLGKLDRALVICLDGRLDGVTSGEFRDKMITWIDDGQHQLIIDCALLHYVSSAGLRVFYQALARVEDKAGTIAFCRVNEAVKRVFDMVDMVADFPMFLTREEAIQHLP